MLSNSPDIFVTSILLLIFHCFSFRFPRILEKYWTPSGWLRNLEVIRSEPMWYLWPPMYGSMDSQAEWMPFIATINGHKQLNALLLTQLAICFIFCPHLYLYNSHLPEWTWQASDVLAVELLQKDARLAVAGELGRPCPGGT